MAEGTEGMDASNYGEPFNKRPVHVAVDRLDKEVAKLGSLISDLLTSLDSVRNPAPEANAGHPTEATNGSPLTQRIAGLTDKVMDQQERLGVLLHELEV